jgi:hypothetical protein
MSFYGLEKPSPGRVIRSTWGAGVVDALDYLYQRSAPFYGGYLSGNITPDTDLLYLIGNPDAKIKEVHAGYGYFTYQVTVNGKPVLKDGDPINIYDIFEPAQEKIIQAIDLAEGYTVGDVYTAPVGDGSILILLPSTDKSLVVKGWKLTSNGLAGETYLMLDYTSRIIGWLPLEVLRDVSNTRVRIVGQLNEPVSLYWAGLTSEVKIFYQLTYREV